MIEQLKQVDDAYKVLQEKNLLFESQLKTLRDLLEKTDLNHKGLHKQNENNIEALKTSQSSLQQKYENQNAQLEKQKQQLAALESIN